MRIHYKGLSCKHYYTLYRVSRKQEYTQYRVLRDEIVLYKLLAPDELDYTVKPLWSGELGSVLSKHLNQLKSVCYLYAMLFH